MKKIEDQHQEALFEWIGYNITRYPELATMHAIPNGGSRHKLEAYNLKKQGVRAGVPDTCLPVGRGEYIGLYIELKIKPNKPSEKQKEWIEMLRKYGNKAEVCYSWQEAVQEIEKYLMLGGDVNANKN